MHRICKDVKVKSRSNLYYVFIKKLQDFAVIKRENLIYFDIFNDVEILQIVV